MRQEPLERDISIELRHSLPPSSLFHLLAQEPELLPDPPPPHPRAVQISFPRCHQPRTSPNLNCPPLCKCIRHRRGRILSQFLHDHFTASLSHLRTMLPESSSCP